MKIDELKYERAVDTAMIVASAKLFFFNKLWSELKGKLEAKKVQPKKLEMIRRYLLNCVAELNETHFFVPLEKVTSQKDVQKYLERKYSSAKELQKITQQLTECMTKKNPTLADFTID